jgi:outer membrane protein assembly factor BamE (lipoprotein component of BamABCDE complex)
MKAFRTFACIALAALAVSTPAVSAPRGFYVAKDQQRSITPGLSCGEVRAILGRPSTDFRYRSTPGPTWTYFVAGSLPGRLVFEVEFDADCRVLAASERSIPLGG